jgi:hypothetical protein
MTVVLYWMSISHPSQAARKMLDLEAQRFPVPALTAQAVRPLVEWYTRTREADGRRASETVVREDLAALPALLDHVDELLGDGTLTLEPPNAATLQIMASVNLMGRFADLAELVASHACAKPARELFPDYRAELPAFLDPDWLEPVRGALRT